MPNQEKLLEILKKIENPIDMGLMIAVYASETFYKRRLTNGQLDYIMGFAREGTAARYLPRLESVGLLEREKGGYKTTAIFKQFASESKIGEAMLNVLIKPNVPG
jgi:hypothetical protein